MKRYTIILMLACTVLLLSSYNHSCSSMDLIQAIKDKKISVVVASTGNHSGKCIQLKITNLSTIPLYIAITPGTLFVPDDEGEQTILSLQNLPIVVQRSETKQVFVSGYCTELHDRCPSAASTFTISRNSNAALESLVQFMTPLKNLKDDLVQQSIWCVTDSQSVTNISLDGDLNSKSIRTFLFKQKGEADPWYSTTRVPEMSADRSIRNSAMEVTGKINIKAVKPIELIGVVKNEAGEVVWKYPYRTSLPAGDIVFDFKLKVTNWKAGNYYMIYTNEGAELVNQKFTI